jgi:hypothetical protein
VSTHKVGTKMGKDSSRVHLVDETASGASPSHLGQDAYIRDVDRSIPQQNMATHPQAVADKGRSR